MDIIRFAVTKPVVVLVGVILLVLFGFVALFQLPYQLAPRVDKPVVTVRTFWPGATPYEIERDIIEEQEKALKGLPNLLEMESESADNMGSVTLRFDLGIEIEDALLRVSNKLDEVPSYPEGAEKPVLSATGAETSPIIYTALQTLPDNPENIYHYLTFFEENVQQFLERVPGVAEVQMRGGVHREMQIVLKPDRLAAYGVTIDQVIAALRGDNVNMSAGNIPVGRRDYRVRAVSEFRSPEDIEDVVVLAEGQRRVYVRDLADVGIGYETQQSIGLQDGVPGIVIPIVAEPDANTLEVTEAVEAAIAELNEGLLAQNGLQIRWLNDQKRYINGAIDLLQQNILFGGMMAVLVLWLFLRSVASTLVVGIAIPISIVGSFIVMRAMGTTLNIISLAGIAFAVGMLVDNAIVVLENIDRHRLMGKTPFQAAYDGAREVWGAILASSLTTVAVFLPVVFLQLEVGLLFRDIAIAVTSAVLISLVVSISVIPMVSRQLFEIKFVHWLEHKTSRFQRLNKLGQSLSGGFMTIIRGVLYSGATRVATIVVLVAGAVGTAYVLLPPMEYLPEGNRDLIFNVIMGPPGLSYEERMEIGQYVSDYLAPYHEAKDGYPPISRVFFMSFGDFMGCGIVSADMQRTRELIPLAQEMLGTIPGVNGISNQAGIFGRGIGEGRTITVDISGNDIDELAATAQAMMMRIQGGAIPESQVRPQPSLDLLYPETRFVPDGERLSAVGMTAQQFGVALDVLMDGRDIGDFKQQGQKKIDLVVKMAEAHIDTPEELYHALIPTPQGRAVPVASLSEMNSTTGLTAIRHYERNRTFSLQITPPYSITLQEAMEIVNGDIVPQMREEGLLDGITVTMSGTADSLTQTRQALQWNFLLAIAITYLLMSALFGNFIYPFIILFTVPLASAGGFIGLRLVNLFVADQQFDILTMLGFIILIGIVVNNAILIVHQSLNNVRIHEMPYKEAVVEAVQSRLRPIYMTAMTSIFGMLPLVVRPGAGTELYRGLGSVVLGGLAVSTIFTVFLIPSLLLFFIGMEGRAKARREAEQQPSEVAVAK